jgi:hypothetical protein
LRDFGGHLVKGEGHRALEAVRPGDQHPHALAERIDGYPRFVQYRSVLVASDHRCLGVFTSRGSSIPPAGRALSNARLGSLMGSTSNCTAATLSDELD